MTDRFIHPNAFTIDLGRRVEDHTPDEITEFTTSSLTDCGFVVLRNMPAPVLEEAYEEAQCLARAADQEDSWRHGFFGRSRYVNTSPEVTHGSQMVRSLGKFIGEYTDVSPLLGASVCRYERQARTAMRRARSGEYLGDLSLQGRMVLEVWHGRERRALTAMRPGDAIILVGGRDGPKMRSWNTTKRVDSDERAQRLGLELRLENTD